MPYPDLPADLRNTPAYPSRQQEFLPPERRGTTDAETPTERRERGLRTKRRLIAAIKRVPLEAIPVVYPGQPPKPLSRQARHLCVQLLERADAETFLDGHILIWARQSTLTADSDYTSARHLLRLQQELHHAGLLDRHLGRNGRRCREEGTGLRLQPALDRLHEIEAVTAAYAARAQQHRSLLGAAKTMRGRIAAQIPYIPARLRSRINGWRENLWPRRLAHLSLAALERHVAFLERITRWLARAVPSFMSDADDSPVRPDTLSLTSESEPQSGAEKTEQAQQEAETQAPEPGPDHLPGDKRTTPRLEITPNTLEEAATPEMKAYLQALRRGATAQRIGEIAMERAYDLGLTGPQIVAARQIMSPMRFLMAILVIDSNRAHPSSPIKVPAAYFHGLLQREATGSLRLDLAIKAIVRRVRSGRQRLGKTFEPSGTRNARSPVMGSPVHVL